VADVVKRRRVEMTGAERALFGIDKLNVPRSDIPAVTHVDHSARIQTVHEDTSLRFHALLSAFKARTGCPVLVNTSFNVRGEPIVCTPEDASAASWAPESRWRPRATAFSGSRPRTRRCGRSTSTRSSATEP
jgi:predicted NodU family carbamoyl transferase